MKKFLSLTLVISFLNFNILAQEILPTPIIVQTVAPEKTFFDYLVILIQISTLLGLIYSLYKTRQITSANEKLAKSAQESLELSKNVLAEMRVSRRQEIAPQIIVYFDMPYGNWHIFLVVKNTGRTAAKDVKISFDPKLQTGFGNKISDFHVAFIDKGISSLVPDQEIRVPFDYLTNYFDSPMTKYLESELPTVYNVAVSYACFFDEEVTVVTQTLDLSMFKGLSVVKEKGQKELIEYLESISNSHKRVAQDLSRLSEDLSGGFWLKNSEISNLLTMSPELLRAQFLVKLNEYKVGWQFVKQYKAGNPLGLFTDNFKPRMSIISYQLLIVLSKRPPFISSELENLLTDIALKLFELGEWRFNDGDNSRFYKAGDELMELVDEVLSSFSFSLIK